MCGSTSEMISPSVRSTRRSTPWVLGCCGPMLTSISSVRTSNSMMVGSCVGVVAVAISFLRFKSFPRVGLFPIQIVNLLRQDLDRLGEQADGVSQLANVVRRFLAAGMAGRRRHALLGIGGELLGQVPGRFVGCAVHPLTAPGCRGIPAGTRNPCGADSPP